MEVVYLTLSRTQVLVSGREDLESRTGIGERGPVGKGRESGTQIPALQLHMFTEGKAGRSGGGLQSLAMAAAAAA